MDTPRARPQERLDPEVRAGLDRLLGFLGPGGLHAIPELQARRNLMRDATQRGRTARGADERVRIDETVGSGPIGSPGLRLRVYRPTDVRASLPAVLYLHGGGMMMGAPEQEDSLAEQIAGEVGCVVLSPAYRLAPEHPYPAAVEDAHAALCWMHEHAEDLGIDRTRIAVYGRSAGGGLAVATTLLARDRGGPEVSYQMLISPMLDDRNESPSTHEIVDLGIWDRAANVQAWQWYLGKNPSLPGPAVPARVEDLRGLPPTYLEAGELDLFRDEDIVFAQRLLQAGVSTRLVVIPKVCHGFDEISPDASVATEAVEARIHALREAFAVQIRPGL
jgi:acetyl esterase/lipase